MNHAMPFELTEGEQCGCIAFGHAGLDPSIFASAPLDLGNGAWILLRRPIDINEPWREWLGSMVTECLDDTHFVLAVKREQNASGRPLNEELDALFYGFLLQGMPLHDASYRFYFSRQNGEVSISHFTELYDHRCFGNTPTIDEGMCRMAKMAADGIISIVFQPEYQRLNRGLRAVIQASREHYGQDALHEFVRGIEALIKPRIGSSKRDFIHRCQTFSIRNAAHATILGECYDTRSNVEHPLGSARDDATVLSRRNVCLYVNK